MTDQNEEEPEKPTIDPDIIKADKIIDRVGLQEVREVYESELDRSHLMTHVDNSSPAPHGGPKL